MFQGKMKAITFSYDDGVTQDQRLIAMLNHYGMKATFNLNSGFFGQIDSSLQRGREIDHSHVPEEDVAAAMEAIQAPVSLSEPVYQDAGDAVYVMDQVKDERVSEDDWVRRLSIQNAMSRLGARERGIIERRFFQGRTQMEVASEIGISQAQVSRLEKAALAQMRRYI